MAKGFQIFLRVQYSILARFNLEVNPITPPVLVKSICFRQKGGCVAVTKKTCIWERTQCCSHHLQTRLPCFSSLERHSDIALASPSNYPTIFVFQQISFVSFAIWRLLFCFSLGNNCQNQSPDANIEILSSCRPFNVLQSSLEANAPRMSLFTWQEHPEMPVQCLHFSSWLFFFISALVFEECHYTRRAVLWNFLPESLNPFAPLFAAFSKF